MMEESLSFYLENEDTKVDLGTTFIVYLSLLRPEIEKIPSISHSNFASLLTIEVVDRVHDDTYFLHSTSHDNSCTLTTFRYFGQKSCLVKYVWG